MAHQKLFTKTRKDLWDSITRLEELGFECKEDGKDTLMCLHNKKRIAFRISKEKTKVGLNIFKNERMLLSKDGIIKQDLGIVTKIYLDGGIETDKGFEITRE